MLGSMTTRDFAAIHMMWGAVNELTTLTGYHALMRRSDHPELHKLLAKVIREEVDALALYLFGDRPAGREQVRGIDRTISEIPGLEGLRLLEDYLDGALRRAAERPGWAGVQSMPGPAAASTNGDAPTPAHWATVGAARDD